MIQSITNFFTKGPPFNSMLLARPSPYNYNSGTLSSIFGYSGCTTKQKYPSLKRRPNNNMVFGSYHPYSGVPFENPPLKPSAINKFGCNVEKGKGGVSFMGHKKQRGGGCPNKFWNDIYLGIKLANSIPTLPNKVDLLHNSLGIRAFRVIGGICLIFSLTKLHLEFNSYYLAIIIPMIGLLQIIYIIIISILRIITIIRNIRERKYEVRNSPVNHIATFTAKTISCLKGVCYGAGGVATIAAGGVTFDQILVDAGYDPVFRPRMARIVRGIGGGIH